MNENILRGEILRPELMMREKKCRVLNIRKIGDVNNCSHPNKAASTFKMTIFRGMLPSWTWIN